MSSPWTAPGTSEDSLPPAAGTPSAPSAEAPGGEASGIGPWRAEPGDGAAWGGAPRPAPTADPAATSRSRELAPRSPLFPLRPLSVGEILGAATRIYRERPRTVFAISVVVLAACYVLTTLLSGISLMPLLQEAEAALESTSSMSSTNVSGGSTVSLVLGTALSGAFTTIGTQLVTVAMVRIAIGEATGRPVSTRETWTALRRRAFPSIVVALVLTILMFLAVLVPAALATVVVLLVGAEPITTTVALILAGAIALVAVLWIWARTMLSVPALVIEELGPLRAIARSFALTRGRRVWRVLGIGLLLQIIMALALQVLQGGFGIVALVVYVAVLLLTNGEQLALAAALLLVLTMLSAFIASVLMTPFLGAGIAAVYADARMRHEGWDVELARTARGTAEAVSAPGTGR